MKIAVIGAGAIGGLVGAKLPWPVRSLAAVSHDTLLVTTTEGALYRVDITGKTTKDDITSVLTGAGVV